MSNNSTNRACNMSKIVSKTHSDHSEKTPMIEAVFFVGVSL